MSSDRDAPFPLCPVRVRVRVVAAGDAARSASIEFWTPGGNAAAPPPARDADLIDVLQQAGRLSGELGLHRSYDFLGSPDDVAAYVESWPEKRAALDELRSQRTLLQNEASAGEHRADGSLKTDDDRASARAMLHRLSAVRASLLRRGFAIAGVQADRI